MGNMIKDAISWAYPPITLLHTASDTSEIISLKTMLMSDQMQKDTDVLTVPVGRSTGNGQLMTLNIALMHHVLIAGTTGSGKSTLLHTWICSILMRAKPEDVRLLLIDPKRVELLGYNGVPHLLTPVIVEPDRGISALQWAHDEMNRRYELLTQTGVRDIGAYNELSGFRALPYILIFIDEFSDLMAYAPDKTEDLVSRMAQMARATGIHMIIATSRPGTDVYTDLLCGGIPAKIVFNTANIDDSMRVIGMGGAEKLLGHGDMLYVPPLEKPIRIQGAYIAEKDIENLTRFLKKQIPRSQILLPPDESG